MGDIKKKQKRFSKPKQLYDRERIDAENEIVKKYGLKNKKEIWKATSEISKIRRRAKELISASDEEKKEFFERLNKMGFKVADISDVLALTEQDLLGRRLQTIVFQKKMANTPEQARQLIVHKHVLVEGAVVNIPSFLVNLEMEDKISLKERKQKVKKEKAVEQPVEKVDAEKGEEVKGDLKENGKE